MAVVPKYTVRKATRADIGAIKTLTDAEEWEIPIGSMYCVFDMDSRAWVVAESETGEIIGCRVLAYFNEETAEGGLYIVRRDLRGKGIGRDVNRVGLTAVGEANITLSAGSVSLYDTHGFTFYYDVLQKRGPAEVILGAIPDAEVSPDINIVPFEGSMFTDLKAYDEKVCESERDYFLKNLIISRAKHILIARSHTGVVVGYGCLGATEYCNEIAPLYADSDIIAWALLKRLLQHLNPKDSVHIFITSENKAMMGIIGKLPLANVVTLHKMYTKKRVPETFERLYSLSALHYPSYDAKCPLSMKLMVC
ncbi:uncharacterized protein LOC124141647 [Haliotis rufescens]|uniref:uncharacterized protein LOC124141647 n=1 Tax=Haliotis rufescens TaxID=6454 RepID=UPI00201F3B30|nr:uncharacterized protein LOC124141647 [Haliotis rufescens]